MELCLSICKNYAKPIGHSSVAEHLLFLYLVLLRPAVT